jgi:hypothetical protein
VSGVRFAMRSSRWLQPIFALVLLLPRFTLVEVDDASIVVRFGWAFRATIPRPSVRTVERTGDVWWAVGVHTNGRGRWIVNGSPHGMVRIDLSPAAPARALGFPVHVRRLLLSLVDPDAFVAGVTAGV